jgi:hypothetical protein
VTSDQVSVTKTDGAQITRQPVSVAPGCEGGSFNFSVEATGDNLTYQWYHNDRKIENATSNRYNGVISSGSAGSYYVEITGTCGTVTSDKVSVTKTDGAQITRQPVSVATGCEGTSFSLSVEATGQNLTYRWYHNGKKIENATSNRYEGVISSGSAGSYHVEITGTCGTVTSDKVTVSMHDGTKIITQPITGFAGCDNDKFSLEIKAAGNNLTYQWYHNDRRIEGANSYKYDGTISSETVGYYHVVVSGTCGSQTSNKANISLYAKTEIIRHPSGVRGCKGDGFILSAEAAGSSVAYQWYYKDQKIEGATSSRYENTISDKTVGYYRVEVTGACGTLISNKVYVGMNTLTMLMKWNDVLYIENAGNRYAGFQWYRNGQAITQYGTSVYYTDQSGLSGVYFVRAYYAGGTYDESCPMTFTASSLRSAAIAVYPNPVSRSEQLTVKIDEPDVSTEGATIRIYNLTGQKLYSARVTHVETLIPVNLTKGTYLMYITVPDGKETVRKIIVK